MIIPVNTLLFRSEGLRVAVARAGKAVLTPITIGRDFGNAVEVLTGVTTSDLVIENPSDSLTSGTPVRLPETRTGASRKEEDAKMTRLPGSRCRSDSPLRLYRWPPIHKTTDPDSSRIPRGSARSVQRGRGLENCSALRRVRKRGMVAREHVHLVRGRMRPAWPRRPLEPRRQRTRSRARVFGSRSTGLVVAVASVVGGGWSVVEVVVVEVAVVDVEVVVVVRSAAFRSGSNPLSLHALPTSTTAGEGAHPQHPHAPLLPEIWGAYRPMCPSRRTEPKNGWATRRAPCSIRGSNQLAILLMLCIFDYQNTN